MLSHTIGDQIRSGIQKDGAFHLVRPVIIVSQSPKTRFNSADDDRGVTIRAPDQIAVYHRRIIRPFSHNASRRVGIHTAPFLGDRIMVDHGIHITGRYQKGQSRLAQNRNRAVVLPIRLRNDSHRISMGFQNSRDNGMSKGRMIHIGISAHIDEIKLLDSALLHIFFTDWQISLVHTVSILLLILCVLPVQRPAYICCRSRSSSSVSLRYSPRLKSPSSNGPMDNLFR